ncbi:MAG: hypothetical protein ACKV2V_01790 [Blastocatellia bacterium]
MEKTLPEQHQLRRYLLGALSEQRRDALEQLCFTDADAHASLCEAENTLIDDYVRGYLGDDDRRMFERAFLSVPARRERVLTAMVLLGEIDRMTTRPAPAAPEQNAGFPWTHALMRFLRGPQLAYGLAAVALLAAVSVAVWMLAQRQALKEQLARADAAQTEQQRRIAELERQVATRQSRNTELSSEIEQLRRTTPPAPAASNPAAAVPGATLLRTILFSLGAGVSRDGAGELPTLKLPPDAGQVKLQVRQGVMEYKRFRATLRTAEGREIFRWSAARATGAALSLTLPAARLQPGDYVLAVDGVVSGQSQEISRLPFKVRRP